MIDIIKIIKPHTVFLETQLVNTNLDQRVRMAACMARFFLKLPSLKTCFATHLNIEIEDEKLITDILNEDTALYRDAFKRFDDSVDPYADDFEELDSFELVLLEGIDSCTNTMEQPVHLAQVFVNVIDTLDYYEQFADDPDYWNQILQKEIAFQKTTIDRLIKGEQIELDTYSKRYKDVEFEQL